VSMQRRVHCHAGHRHDALHTAPTALHKSHAKHNSMTTLLILYCRAGRVECNLGMLPSMQIDGVPEVAVTTPATAAICTATLPNSKESRGRAIVLTRLPTEQPVHNKADLWMTCHFCVSTRALQKDRTECSPNSRALCAGWRFGVVTLCVRQSYLTKCAVT